MDVMVRKMAGTSREVVMKINEQYWMVAIPR